MSTKDKNIHQTIHLDLKIDSKEKLERELEIKNKKEKNENYQNIIHQKLTINKKEIEKSSSNSSTNSDNNSPLKLKYSRTTFYIILIINIFLPGIGTIIAGIGWGDTCKIKNRTKELIFRGIIQFFTIIYIVGYIQAIRDAKNYFK